MLSMVVLIYKNDFKYDVLIYTCSVCYFRVKNIYDRISSLLRKPLRNKCPLIIWSEYTAPGALLYLISDPNEQDFDMRDRWWTATQFIVCDHRYKCHYAHLTLNNNQY